MSSLFKFSNISVVSSVTSTGIDLFNTYYPESQTYSTSCNLYYITNKNDNSLYFNINNRCWTTDNTQATYFITQESASAYVKYTPYGFGNPVKLSKQISIKYLTNDAEISFPIYKNTGFMLPNINDYIK